MLMLLVIMKELEVLLSVVELTDTKAPLPNFRRSSRSIFLFSL